VSAFSLFVGLRPAFDFLDSFIEIQPPPSTKKLTADG
jgi:hypothetical protein